MWTGPFLMIQVYDPVLTPRSEATLSGISAFLFWVIELLDHLRAGVLARVGARDQARLDPGISKRSDWIRRWRLWMGLSRR